MCVCFGCHIFLHVRYIIVVFEPCNVFVEAIDFFRHLGELQTSLKAGSFALQPGWLALNRIVLGIEAS